MLGGPAAREGGEREREECDGQLVVVRVTTAQDDGKEQCQAQKKAVRNRIVVGQHEGGVRIGFKMPNLPVNWVH